MMYVYFHKVYFPQKLAEILSHKVLDYMYVYSCTYMHMTLFIYVTHMCINKCNYSQATFPSMYASLDLGNPGVWAQFASSSQCEREFPPSLMKKISPFQQVGRHYSYVHIPTVELKRIVNLLSRYRDHG